MKLFGISKIDMQIAENKFTYKINLIEITGQEIIVL